MKYLVVYEQAPNNWAAYVPDLPGCIAAADTRAEAEQLIREAIPLHVELLRRHGDPVPTPGAWTSIVEIDDEPAGSDAVASKADFQRDVTRS